MNPDHLYREVKREPKVFQPLQIPRALQAELPYHLKPKVCGGEGGIASLEVVNLFTCLGPDATDLAASPSTRTVFPLCQPLFPQIKAWYFFIFNWLHTGKRRKFFHHLLFRVTVRKPVPSPLFLFSCRWHYLSLFRSSFSVYCSSLHFCHLLFFLLWLYVSLCNWGTEDVFVFVLFMFLPGLRIRITLIRIGSRFSLQCGSGSCSDQSFDHWSIDFQGTILILQASILSVHGPPWL